MPKGFWLFVRGHVEALDAINARRKKIRSGIAASAKAAARIFLAGAKSTRLFRDYRNILRRSLRIKRITAKQTFVLYLVGPDWRKAPHWHLVELGHKLVSSKKHGHRVLGHVEARPFMRETYKQKKTAAEAVLTLGIKQTIA